MIKTPQLEQLCSELNKKLPNWDKIIAKFKQVPEFDGKVFDIKAYSQHFSELHLTVSLEDIAEKYPELNISLAPFEDVGDSSYNFQFFCNRAGRVYARAIENRQTFEYDELILVGESPVVFEIKVGRWKGEKKKETKKGEFAGKLSKMRGVQYAFRPEKYSKKLGPLRELFRRDVGYVIIIPGKKHASPYVADFKENNGLVVPFYTYPEPFRKEVANVVKLYGLELKPMETKDLKTPN